MIYFNHLGIHSARVFRVCIFLILAASPIHAQQDTTVVPIPRLEVTVTRIAEPLARVPAAVSVVNQTDIQRAQPGIGLEEALAHVPGLIVNNRYNFALGTRISIRGYGARAAFGIRGIRVLTDGVPLTMPDGQANLNNVDLTSTGRIEVLRGAASMLYGNAAGGVVAFESEVPRPGFGVQARLIAGSDDLLRMNAKLGGGSERTRYLINFARLDAEGFRRHSAVEQNNLNARIRHEFENQSYLALTLNAADAPTALNPGSLPIDSARDKPEMAWPRNAATFSGESARQIQLGLEHGRTIGPVKLNAVGYALTRSLDNPLPFAYIMLERNAGGLRSSLQSQFGIVALSGGVDVELQSDDREETNNLNGQPGSARTRDQTDRIVNIGPYLRASIDINSAVTGTAGIRYDRTHFETSDRFLTDGRDDSGDRVMSAVSPMVGATLRLSENVSAYASVSTAFQTPTTTELINNPTGTGFNALDPQRSVSYEAGVRGSKGRVAGEVTAYHSRVRDALVPFQLTNGDGREFFRNAGRTKQQGVEAAAQIRLTRDLRVATSYTFSDFTFIDDGLPNADFEGNELPGVPPHHATARVTWSNRALHVELEAEHTSSYYSADNNADTSQNPSATVFDLRLAGVPRIGSTRFEPFIGLNNLFDERYFSSVVINAAGARYFEPAPGRNVYIGLSVSTGSWP
jgi:iron complex outermembrane recepter protein